MTVIFADSSGSGKWSYQFVRFDIGIEFWALCEKVAQLLTAGNEAPPFSSIYVDVGSNLPDGVLEVLPVDLRNYLVKTGDGTFSIDKSSAWRCAIGYPSTVVSTHSARRFRLEMGACFFRVVEALPVSQNTKERIQIEIRAWGEVGAKKSVRGRKRCR